MIEKEVKFSEIDKLIKQGYIVEIDSPDGYVKVNEYVIKGNFIEYIAECGGKKLSCNENHKFDTNRGWIKSKDIKIGDKCLMYSGKYEDIKVIKTENIIPIVDCSVDHENQRYYANGISSHNSGKSLWLCHLAAHYMSQGLKVLYITMEMAEERIAERIDANLLDISLQKLKTIDKEKYLKAIDNFKKHTKGNLIVKEYPTASAHAGHFRHLLNELKNKKGYIPDVLLVDYVNICASSRIKMGNAVNSYTMVKSVAEELRGLGVEYNIPVWTATQSGRQSTGVSDMDIDDVSESFGLVQTVDFMFAIISTPELDELYQQLIKILKNRYGSTTDDRLHTVGINKSKMKVFDLSDGNTPSISNTNTPTIKKPNGRDFSGFKI